MKSAISCQFEVPFRFRVYFTEGVFDSGNKLLADVLRSEGKRRQKLLAIMDKGLVAATPESPRALSAYLAASNLPLVRDPVVLPGGEVLKNQSGAVTELYRLIEAYKLSRHSFIIAIGGGALLDVVGFAAATAHRGVRCIRLPTTTL